VPVTATGADLLALLRTPFTRYPVVGEAGDLDEVEGVVHAEDLLRFPAHERPAVPVRELLREALFVPESMLATEVVRRLRSSGSQMAVVLDEYGGTAGILTAEDLVEELVGDIVDEHDAEVHTLVPDGDGAWVVPGRLRVDELAREAGLELPEGDYETLAGLVLNRLGRIPSAGDEVLVDGVLVRVVEVRGRQVAVLRVERLAEPGPERTTAEDEP
jgi:CBS domain containing-hemolysin-like protein